MTSKKYTHKNRYESIFYTEASEGVFDLLSLKEDIDYCVEYLESVRGNIERARELGCDTVALKIVTLENEQLIRFLSFRFLKEEIVQ